MNVIDSASGAVQVVERGGVVAALVLCIAGLIAAVIALWRANRALVAKLQDIQAAHCQWAHAELERRHERDHSLAAIRATCELVGNGKDQENRDGAQG